MDKEVLEIIDTAVKIGLGSLITAVSAYFLSKSNFNLEKVKRKSEKHISFLEEIAIKIEQAKYKLEEAAHPYWHEAIDLKSTPSKEAAKLSIDLYLKATALIGEARALTYLLNIKELKEHLDEAEQIILKIYQATALGKDLENVDDINKKLSSIEKVFENCFKELSKAYNNA